MKKSKILTMVTVSTLVLAQAGTAFADEVTIGSDTATEQISSGTSDSGVQVETPTDSSTDQGQDTGGTGTVIGDDSTATETPNDGGGVVVDTPTDESSSTDTASSSSDTQTDSGESQTETSDTTSDNQTAYDAGASQVGTTSQVTGQIVRDVTTANPVTLISGVTITDIQAGVATLSDGSSANLTDLGVTENEDKTFSATTIDGEQVTLPETGESTVGVVVGLLIILAGLGLGFKDKLKAIIDNVKAKSKK